MSRFARNCAFKSLLVAVSGIVEAAQHRYPSQRSVLRSAGFGCCGVIQSICTTFGSYYCTSRCKSGEQTVLDARENCALASIRPVSWSRIAQGRCLCISARRSHDRPREAVMQACRSAVRDGHSASNAARTIAEASSGIAAPTTMYLLIETSIIQFRASMSSASVV